MSCYHKYFIATTKNAFEIVEASSDNHDLHYRMIEYAYLMCTKCFNVIKQEVDIENNSDNQENLVD